MQANSKLKKRLRVFTGLLLGTCGAVVTQLWGQGATATMLGTVTDPSGAAIPDASVQARNVGTGDPSFPLTPAGRGHRPLFIGTDKTFRLIRCEKVGRNRGDCCILWRPGGQNGNPG
jgi:hypothetical protein